jgi:hypothetical protein
MIDTRQIFALKRDNPNGSPEAVDLLCQAIADACNNWLGDTFPDSKETAQSIKSSLVGVKMGGTRLDPYLTVTLASCVWRLRIDNNRLVAKFIRDI